MPDVPIIGGPKAGILIRYSPDDRFRVDDSWEVFEAVDQAFHNANASGSFVQKLGPVPEQAAEFAILQLSEAEAKIVDGVKVIPKLFAVRVRRLPMFGNFRPGLVKQFQRNLSPMEINPGLVPPPDLKA